MPEGITFTTQTQIDSFHVNYPECSEIEGDVTIDGDDITNLYGLNVFTTIYGDLVIGYPSWGGTGNPLLTNLEGLDNLNYIGGNLFIDNQWISNNSNLISLSGLESLISVGANVEISYNDQLTSLSGLESLVSIGGGFEIRANESLTNLSGPESLSSIGENLSVYQNESLVNLIGLEELTSIGGGLYLYTNDSLTSLTGLYNLFSIGGSLLIYDNYVLSSLTGLDNLTSVEGGVSISDNEGLINFNGLENLITIGENISINWNNSLSSLNGLEGLTSIGGSISFGGNVALTNITGLQNLTTIGGSLSVGFVPLGGTGICGNPSLTSLIGLDNIEAASIDHLTIIGNDQLVTCDVESICDYLAGPNGTIEIHDNAPGCNSQEEVEEACAQSVDEVSIINNLSIHPNPFSNTITIEFELKQPEIITITIYNHLGQKVEGNGKKTIHGKQQIEWNAEGLPAGVYFCALKTNEGTQTKKMIKL